MRSGAVYGFDSLDERSVLAKQTLSTLSVRFLDVSHDVFYDNCFLSSDPAGTRRKHHNPMRVMGSSSGAQFSKIWQSTPSS